MDREEAIRELKIQFVGEYDRQREAKDIAIKALEQQPCEDAISRQAAIDAIENTKSVKSEDGEIYVAKINAEMNIQQLPSVSTETTNRCEDSISRKSAIDLIDSMAADATSHGITPRLLPDYVIDGIESLPFVSCTEKPNRSKFEFDEEQEQLDFVQPHKKIKVNLVKFDTHYTDAISRQAAIDAMREETCGCCWDARDILEHLPSVNPQASKEDIHREREQAYMCGYEDASRKYRTEPCTDAISRQAVIEGLASIAKAKAKSDAQKSLMGRVMFFTEQLPSVSTEKTGRWIEQEGYDGDTYYDCSECGESFCLIDGTPTDNLYNYCPNCGARMGVEE